MIAAESAAVACPRGNASLYLFAPVCKQAPADSTPPACVGDVWFLAGDQHEAAELVGFMQGEEQAFGREQLQELVVTRSRRALNMLIHTYHNRGAPTPPAPPSPAADRDAIQRHAESFIRRQFGRTLRPFAFADVGKQGSVYSTSFESCVEGTEPIKVIVKVSVIATSAVPRGPTVPSHVRVCPSTVIETIASATLTTFRVYGLVLFSVPCYYACSYVAGTEPSVPPYAVNIQADMSYGEERTGAQPRVARSKGRRTAHGMSELYARMRVLWKDARNSCKVCASELLSIGELGHVMPQEYRELREAVDALVNFEEGKTAEHRRLARVAAEWWTLQRALLGVYFASRKSERGSSVAAYVEERVIRAVEDGVALPLHALLTQVVIALGQMQYVCGFVHGDSHSKNWLVIDTPAGSACEDFRFVDVTTAESYGLPSEYGIVRPIDFGYSALWNGSTKPPTYCAADTLATLPLRYARSPEPVHVGMASFDLLRFVVEIYFVFGDMPLYFKWVRAKTMASDLPHSHAVSKFMSWTVHATSTPTGKHDKRNELVRDATMSRLIQSDDERARTHFFQTFSPKIMHKQLHAEFATPAYWLTDDVFMRPWRRTTTTATKTNAASLGFIMYPPSDITDLSTWTPPFIDDKAPRVTPSASTTSPHARVPPGSPPEPASALMPTAARESPIPKLGSVSASPAAETSAQRAALQTEPASTRASEPRPTPALAATQARVPTQTAARTLGTGPPPVVSAAPGVASTSAVHGQIRTKPAVTPVTRPASVSTFETAPTPTRVTLQAVAAGALAASEGPRTSSALSSDATSGMSTERKVLAGASGAAPVRAALGDTRVASAAMGMAGGGPRVLTMTNIVAGVKYGMGSVSAEMRETIRETAERLNVSKEELLRTETRELLWSDACVGALSGLVTPGEEGACALVPSGIVPRDRGVSAFGISQVAQCSDALYSRLRARCASAIFRYKDSAALLAEFVTRVCELRNSGLADVILRPIPEERPLCILGVYALSRVQNSLEFLDANPTCLDPRSSALRYEAFGDTYACFCVRSGTRPHAWPWPSIGMSRSVSDAAWVQSLLQSAASPDVYSWLMWISNEDANVKALWKDACVFMRFMDIAHPTATW